MMFIQNERNSKKILLTEEGTTIKIVEASRTIPGPRAEVYGDVYER
jgi:hypothetical protein